jgi:hypothetical protein
VDSVDGCVMNIQRRSIAWFRKVCFLGRNTTFRKVSGRHFVSLMKFAPAASEILRKTFSDLTYAND